MLMPTFMLADYVNALKTLTINSEDFIGKTMLKVKEKIKDTKENIILDISLIFFQFLPECISNIVYVST